MARWRLTGPHYLMVPGTEWEYSEITRDGKQSRQRFKVPTLLDPREPPSVASPHGKNVELIVCHIDKGQPGDIEFEGQPTPDMIPLDDEAKVISAELAETAWKVQPELLHDSFGAHLERNLEKQLLQLRKDTLAQQQPLQGVEQILAAMTAMMQQNQQLITALVEQKMHPPQMIVADDAEIAESVSKGPGGVTKVARRA